MAPDVNKSFSENAPKKHSVGKTLGFGFLSAAIALMPMAATAQQPAHATNIQTSTQARYVSPLEQTGKHSGLSTRNIGILITYGKGNRVSPDEAGVWVKKQLDTYAATKGKSYNARYFIRHTNKGEGIAVSYSVGGVQGVGPKDISDAKNPKVLDEVFQKRDTTARILASSGPTSTHN